MDREGGRLGARRVRGRRLSARDVPPEVPPSPVAWVARARAWLAAPERRQGVTVALFAALVLAGLLLPPVSLVTRLTAIGYTAVRAGTQTAVRSEEGGASLEIDRLALQRSTRARVWFRDDDAADLREALPTGREPVSAVVGIDFKGPVPRRAWLSVPLSVRESDRPYIDPYAWDGQRWRWLAPQFTTGDRVRIQLPLDTFVPEWVVVTRATESATELSATLLPPPATVPAAVAELPILESRAYRLSADDGTIEGEAMPLPSREARRYGVVSNLDGPRVRTDLVNNMLIRPSSRQRNREAIVEIVRRDELDGIVLDYRGIAGDLQPEYVDFVRRLADDLHRRRAELVVMVPMPSPAVDSWDPGSVPWQELGAAADGVRLALPSGVPLDLEALDSLVQWALRHVERARLQLALPVQGRDLVEGEVRAISFGEALGEILDMARSDVPARIGPGESRLVELPTLRASELGRDPDTGMWRFYYWDGNRRQHTVWLNDASGLHSAFEIAARYRLGRLAMDGVEAGLDPAVWDLARQFLAGAEVEPRELSYRLQWRLTDGDGRIVQEAIQPLGEASFAIRAPRTPGDYHLGVNLVSESGDVVALGATARVAVAPAPPPTPKPTELLIYLAPTPMPFVTAPAPPDELVRQRTPVRITQAAATLTPNPLGARLAAAAAQLRAGPDVSSEKLSDLRAGDVLTILGRNGDGSWLRVRVTATGVEGWVLSELLAFDADPDALPVWRAETPTP